MRIKILLFAIFLSLFGCKKKPEQNPNDPNAYSSFLEEITQQVKQEQEFQQDFWEIKRSIYEEYRKEQDKWFADRIMFSNNGNTLIIVTDEELKYLTYNPPAVATSFSSFFSEPVDFNSIFGE